MATQSVELKEKKRLRISIQGAVQGVGFRPFVYRLAQELKLKGWIQNTTEGVMIEVEGEFSDISDFQRRLHKEKPQLSFFMKDVETDLDPCGYESFEIRHSEVCLEKIAYVLPDIATCSECLQDILDPTNRRYLYPFTNCTNCGPRYSIIEALPYDRENTSMNQFDMCPDCQREYNDPLNRRFHAQPNACPQCGPHLELWNKDQKILATHHEAMYEAVQAIKQGKIVAVKGIGGFHLFVDAANEESVLQLRKRKHRSLKPFAIMAPSLENISQYAKISKQEKSLLTSEAAPIVLLSKKENQFHKIANSVAPENPNLGVMLPYSPLHHLLMKALDIPVVATSGNLADESICIDEKEAIQRLVNIADLFLVHNRGIVRSVDDSVVRIMMNQPSILRRSRGYAPLPITIQQEGPSVLALGGHLKNTVALSVKNNVFISQHIGDLESIQSCEAFGETTKSLENLYSPSLKCLVSDSHPDYYSTKFAKDSSLPLLQVQHHHAHIVSCMAEHHLNEEALGIAFDGTGYGEDQSIWGGEFLLSNLSDFKRVGHFKPFRLPGGEHAIKEPRRTAIAVLFELFGNRFLLEEDLAPIKAFRSNELYLIEQMMEKHLNSPLTSSVGRLFDAAASLLDVCQFNQYEGQAAMSLEYILGQNNEAGNYHYEISQDNKGVYIVDWKPMIKAIIADLRSDISKEKISAKFHNTIAEIVISLAKEIKKEKIVLSGGCFQNKYLTERLVTRLKEENFLPYWHKEVPSNDGGIALGQAVVGMSRIRKREQKV